MRVLFCGSKSSGKDTAGNYLVDNYGFKKASFASPLKRMAEIAFPNMKRCLYGESHLREQTFVEYKFSGICPKCTKMCVRCNEDLFLGYYCRRCKENYPYYLTPRLVLQSLGTEWGRRLYNDLWVDATFRSLDRRTNYVITDGRFANEVTYARAMGAMPILLLRNRPEETPKWKQFFGAPRFYGHASETEIHTIPHSKFTHVIDNSECEVELLYHRIDQIMGGIRGK